MYPYQTPVAVAQPVVTLTQIPYTGFDFGPVGDAMYWAALLTFAVAAAYMLVYYSGTYQAAAAGIRSIALKIDDVRGV